MMFFLMENLHHSGKDAERDRLRPMHRDWVRSGGDGLCSVIIGSATWDADGAAIGHWGVLEAASEAEARAFSEGDPFYAEGVVRELRLTRLADGFKADRISERLTASG